MRIAIFTDTFLPQVNGVVTVVRQSAKALADQGHQICIVTASSYSTKELKKLTDNQFEIINLPSVSFWAYRGERLTFPFGWSLFKVRKFKPDIIHSHTPFAIGWEAVLCAKILRVPLVGTHHTFFDHYLKYIKLDYSWAKTLSWKIFTAYFNRCNLVLSPSKALANGLKNSGLKRPVEIISNPIDTNAFQPINSPEAKEALKKQLNIEGQSIVYMGRMGYEKSIDQVIRAFAQANKQCPDTKLVLVGDGPERSNLEAIIRTLGLENKVIFTGIQQGEKLTKLLQANDLFATASKSENMPMSILEAMASGLPIVAVAANGLPEIVKDKINGHLVAPDQPEAMAEKMVDLFKDQTSRLEMAKASRQLSLQYSQPAITSTLINSYEQLIK